MSLGEVRNWVFDMDGTLTVAVHDFAAIRVALDIPAEHDILTHLAALPARKRRPSMPGCWSTKGTWQRPPRRPPGRWNWCESWPGAGAGWVF